MKKLFDKLHYQLQQNLPFVIYSKPNSNSTVGLFLDNDELTILKDFSNSGFVFSPFDDEERIFFSKERLEVLSVANQFEAIELGDTVKAEPENEEVKRSFESLVVKAVKTIKFGACEKIVVSRKEKVVVPNFNIEVSFKKMLQLYPTAFKYCWFHPKVGMWMGATPEQFLKINNNELKTVALAGTRLKSETENWGEKEKIEQQLVTDFIVENIEQYTQAVKTSMPYTVNAGSLQHIKTDISACLEDKSNLVKIIEVLHPTPAVCGYPKDIAKSFIIENEGYDRSFYAGFLGELNNADGTNDITSDLFVNLRCMQVFKNEVELYAGCGITADSNPENEFWETVNKAATMKKIL